MAYIPIGWTNTSTTPLNADNLNHMDEQIKANTLAVENLQTEQAKVITTDKLDTKAVTTDKIADGAVNTDKIDTKAVSSAKLADGAVTYIKIANGNVTEEKLSDPVKLKLNYVPVVDSEMSDTSTNAVQNKAVKAYVDGRIVTGDNIADGAITTDKIADGTITTNDLANGCINASKLQDYSVITSKINDGSVTEMKLSNEVKAKLFTGLADGSVIFSKLSTALQTAINSIANKCEVVSLANNVSALSTLDSLRDTTKTHVFYMIPPLSDTLNISTGCLCVLNYYKNTQILNCINDNKQFRRTYSPTTSTWGSFVEFSNASKTYVDNAINTQIGNINTLLTALNSESGV